MIQKKEAHRQRHQIKCRSSTSLHRQGKALINVASNDYLNLSQHPEVKESFAKAAERYGLGSGASALVTGYHEAHAALEEKFSHFLKRKALLFNSGYHANLTIFQVLATRHSLILSDKECHASLLDGIRLSRALHKRFPHQNIDQLAQRLTQHQQYVENIIVTESIFSMSGDLTQLPKLTSLCKKTNSLLYLDDAHGFGVLGQCGRGALEHFQLEPQEIFCLVQPLGKALGSMGAIVSGSEEFIELLLQQSRSYRYSTALPPAVAIATLTALECLEKESWRRLQLKEHCLFFNKLAKQHEVPLLSWDSTPIRSILLGSNERAMACHHFLQEHGYLAACIRPTTVPHNKARLRISLSSELKSEEIESLLKLVAEWIHGKK